jgi:hypothetical protein
LVTCGCYELGEKRADLKVGHYMRRGNFIEGRWMGAG